jgi:hypothetical protein
MPRFVVLLHETPPGYPRPAHYDLMFEQGGVLWTWAAQSLPKLGGSDVSADRLADHRLDYLDYEGAVSGGRGHVQRIDGGDYDRIPSSDETLSLRLYGHALRGVLILRLKSAAADSWLLQLRSEGKPQSAAGGLPVQ